MQIDGGGHRPGCGPGGLRNHRTRVVMRRVRFISLEVRLRKSSAEGCEGRSDLKSPQKSLGRALPRLPKSCPAHLKHTIDEELLEK